jgi:hypothetical protein
MLTDGEVTLKIWTVYERIIETYVLEGKARTNLKNQYYESQEQL